ncbi:hypothetical protein [Pediococcus acidilactici]|uniref:hypothetical protein n=1 Tax=Pediococcus acidilactici TaxID=1254 RepID=UPI002F265C70
MKNVYVIRRENLYYKGIHVSIANDWQYAMTDNLNKALLSEDFDGLKNVAEDIGGKVYKINLEEAEADD